MRKLASLKKIKKIGLFIDKGLQRFFKEFFSKISQNTHVFAKGGGTGED